MYVSSYITVLSKYYLATKLMVVKELSTYAAFQNDTDKVICILQCKHIQCNAYFVNVLLE